MHPLQFHAATTTGGIRDSPLVRSTDALTTNPEAKSAAASRRSEPLPIVYRKLSHSGYLVGFFAQALQNLSSPVQPSQWRRSYRLILMPKLRARRSHYNAVLCACQRRAQSSACSTRPSFFCCERQVFFNAGSHRSPDENWRLLAVMHDEPPFPSTQIAIISFFKK